MQLIYYLFKIKQWTFIIFTLWDQFCKLLLPREFLMNVSLTWSSPMTWNQWFVHIRTIHKKWVCGTGLGFFFVCLCGNCNGGRLCVCIIRCVESPPLNAGECHRLWSVLWEGIALANLCCFSSFDGAWWRTGVPNKSFRERGEAPEMAENERASCRIDPDSRGVWKPKPEGWVKSGSGSWIRGGKTDSLGRRSWSSRASLELI